MNGNSLLLTAADEGGFVVTRNNGQGEPVSLLYAGALDDCLAYVKVKFAPPKTDSAMDAALADPNASLHFSAGASLV